MWTGVFQLGFHLALAESVWFQRYLVANARVVAWILRPFEPSLRVEGASLYSDRVALTVSEGCDGVQPCVVFLAGVLAFPASRRQRVAALAVGLPILLGVNVLRVLHLWHLGAVSERWFSLAHLQLWPMGLLLLALGMWFLWARRRLAEQTASGPAAREAVSRS